MEENSHHHLRKIVFWSQNLGLRIRGPPQLFSLCLGVGSVPAALYPFLSRRFLLLTTPHPPPEGEAEGTEIGLELI